MGEKKWNLKSEGLASMWVEEGGGEEKWRLIPFKCTWVRKEEEERKRAREKHISYTTPRP